MGRDVTAFRERFKAYKNGKSVSEIYDAGLPRYAGGTPGLTKAQEAALDELYEWGNSLGYDTMSIAGIGGNGLQESGLNYNAKSKSGYAGLLQNNKNIQQAIIEQYGDYSPASQRQYIHDWNTRAKWITKGKYSPHTATNSGRYKTKGYASTDEASDAWMKLYERPVILDSNGKVIGYQEQDKRRAYTKLAYEYLNNKYGKPQVPAQEPSPYIAKPVSTAVRPTIPAEQTVPAYDPTISPYISGKPMVKLRPRVQLPNLVEVMEDSEWESPFQLTPRGYKNGKLPGYKIGHNVSNAKLNEDGTFTDDYTKVFEDMYVTPQKTDLKRGSYTLNNFPYYLQHRTDWMKPFMSSGTNEKGLELVHPEFDLLLGGRQLVTEILPLKQSAKTATEQINFKDFGKAVQKMKAEDDAFRAAHPEYEIDNFLKSRKIPDDSNILDVLSKSNLEEKPTRDIFHKLLYENENLHGKQIVNLHNNRARLTGDPVDEVGRVFDVDDPKGREAALQWLEDNYFGSREGAEYALKDPGIISRLKGFSLPKGDRPVFISKKKLVQHQEQALGRKLTEQEADDLYYKVISHERHHSFDRIHDIPEGFDLSKIKTGDYFAKDGFDELAARGTQLKNMFGLVNKPLTGAHLRYAESQYFKDPSNINNNMLQFFNLITDYDKAAKWLQKNASVIAPIGLSTATYGSLKQNK